MKNTL